MDRPYAALTRNPALIAGVLPAGFLVLFYLYPVTAIFIKSFFYSGSSDFSAFHQVITSRRLLNTIWFSVWQAGVSTIVTLAVALPCAFMFARYSFKYKAALMVLATIPFVLPTVVVAAAFQALIGEKGLVPSKALNHPLFMIILAHVFYNFSVVLRIVSGYWQHVSGRFSDSAAVLGANPVKRLLLVELPLVRPAIFASALLVFIFCFCSFGVIMILGGAYYTTIEVEIYRQAAHLFNLPAAAVLSVIQIAFTFVLMWFYTRFQKKTLQVMPESSFLSGREYLRPLEKIFIAACTLFILCLTLMPMMALAVKSVLHQGDFSLVYYRALFQNVTDSLFYISPYMAIKNSMLFSIVTLMMSGIIGVTAAYAINASHRHIGHILDPVFMLPLSTSAVTLGFGIILTMDSPVIDLRTSAMLIPVAHTLIAFPFVIRAVLPAIRSIPDRLKNAGSVLGASRFKCWLYIELPIIAKAVTIGLIFSFTISLGEFGATVFTARPEFSTMPMAIFRFLGSPGQMNYGQAMAMSVILMCMTALGFVIIEKLSFIHRDYF